MDKPKIADTKPCVLEIAPGKYAYCACGVATEQPFCDGSHAGTGFKPQIFEMTEEKTVALCACKRTGNPPFCDGTHATLGEDG
jgi:CDGSH-type Zn-finger protein